MPNLVNKTFFSVNLFHLEMSGKELDQRKNLYRTNIYVVILRHA